MKRCGVCGGEEHRAATYEVRDSRGATRSFPALECIACGCTEPDANAIDLSEDLPESVRTRCHQVASVPRMEAVRLSSAPNKRSAG